MAVRLSSQLRNGNPSARDLEQHRRTALTSLCPDSNAATRKFQARFWFMVWREAGAVRSARRSRGLGGVQPKEGANGCKKGQEKP